MVLQYCIYIVSESTNTTFTLTKETNIFSYMHLCFFETSSEWAFGSKSYRIIPLICRCIFLWDLLFCCDLWYCQSQTSWRYQNLVRGDELQSQPPKMVSRGFLHHCCKTKGHVCWKLGCMNAEAIITLITWFFYRRTNSSPCRATFAGKFDRCILGINIWSFADQTPPNQSCCFAFCFPRNTFVSFGLNDLWS